MRRRIVAVGVAIGLFPVLAAAQAVRAFEDVRRVVAPGQQVVVTDVGGGKTRGDIVDATSDAVTLRVSDAFGARRTRTFAAETVASIRRSDRLWNGLLIGIGAGFLASEVWVYNVCGPRGYDAECSAIATGIGWVAFVPGAAVAGALIDKAVGNHLIYTHATQPGALVITPTLTPARAAIAATIRF